MTREEVLALARKAGFKTGIIYYADGEGSYPVAYSEGESCFIEIERLVDLTGVNELLSALKAMRSKYGEYACEACDMADKAIAKAKGEL